MTTNIDAPWWLDHQDKLVLVLGQAGVRKEVAPGLADLCRAAVPGVSDQAISDYLCSVPAHCSPGSQSNLRWILEGSGSIRAMLRGALQSGELKPG